MTHTTKLLGAVAGVAMAFGVATGAQAAIIGGPGNASAATIAAAFTSAGINFAGGNNWNYVAPPEIFGDVGTGGNGVFITGGSVEFVLRLAGYHHQFGVADDVNNHQSPTVIFDTNNVTVGATAAFTAAIPGSDYVFFFSTLDAGSDNGTIFSDDNDGTSGQRDMAIFVNNATGEYAFFYDDAGGTCVNPGAPGVFCQNDDDNDYNDMVVVARSSSVPEPMTLGLLGLGLAGLGAAARRRRSA